MVAPSSSIASTQANTAGKYSGKQLARQLGGRPPCSCGAGALGSPGFTNTIAWYFGALWNKG
jgi:hypothetical protein